MGRTISCIANGFFYFSELVFGLLISKTCNTSRKLILAGGIIIDLSILGYFKYAGFFAKIINFVVGSNLFTIPKISLPIGISFFTFQAISYIVDVYRRDTEASNNPVNVALYISFFPQLIAGPIVKYRDINKLKKERFDGMRFLMVLKDLFMVLAKR